MIYIVATLTLKPGTRDAAVAAAKPCIEATRQEPGCIRYDLNADVTDENKLVFVEQWETREDIDLHLKAPHLLAWREAGGQYFLDRKIEVITPENVEVL